MSPAVPAAAAVPVAAAEPAPSAAPAPARPVFLWKAQMGPSSFHFLGSVHVARPELYPLDARIESAFAASDVLVLELDLDPAAQIRAAERMLELGRLEPGKELESVIAPATWQLLQQTAQRRGFSLFGLRGFRPWFVALALTTQALEKEGFSAEQGIDEHFRRSAEGRVRIEALETVEEQLSLFTALGPDAEEHLLRQTLEEIDHYGEQLDASFELWRAGDAAGLDTLLLEPMRKTYPELFARLFTERNRKMMARLKDLAKTPARYFVVVGGGHLVGSGGLLGLLKSDGIPVDQL